MAVTHLRTSTAGYEACLTGEYCLLGQHADFEDVGVQRLFYKTSSNDLRP